MGLEAAQLRLGRSRRCVVAKGERALTESDAPDMVQLVWAKCGEGLMLKDPEAPTGGAGRLRGGRSKRRTGVNGADPLETADGPFVVITWAVSVIMWSRQEALISIPWYQRCSSSHKPGLPDHTNAAPPIPAQV